MHYEKYTPTPALHAFVEWYYILEHDSLLHSSLDVEVPANCCMALVLSYGDRLARFNERHAMERLPQHFLTGPATLCCTLNLSGRHSILGVVFKAAGALRLFDVSAGEVMNKRIPLELVLGPEREDLIQQVQEAERHQQKIAVMEAFLMGKLKESSLRTDWTDWAVEIIQKEKGAVNMDALSRLLNVSPRQLRRRFKERFGVGPKLAARIKRFGYANLLLSQRPELDWQDVIHLAGFYDQAHFIKDFTQFAGHVPSEILRRYQVQHERIHAAS